MARYIMDFNLAVPAANIVLQFSDRSLERISYGNKDILIPMIAADDYFGARHRKINPRFIEAALMLVLAGSFDSHLAMHDVAGELIQLFGALSDLCVDRVGLWNIAKNGMERNYHDDLCV